MTSPLVPLASNDLFGGVPTEWQRQSAFIDHFIQAVTTAMSIVATQLPNIQASFVAPAPSPRHPTSRAARERHDFENHRSLAVTTVNQTPAIREAQLFHSKDSSRDG